MALADCQEYKIVDHGDRVEAVCAGDIPAAKPPAPSKPVVGHTTEGIQVNGDAKAFAEKYMEYASEKQRNDIERSKLEIETLNAQVKQYDRPPGYYSGRTFQPEEVKKGSIVDVNGRVIQ